MVVISTRKDKEEVLDALAKWGGKKITMVACGTCAAMCGTGGTEAPKDWQPILEGAGYEVEAVLVAEDVCDNRVLIKDFRKINDEISNTDVILSLACGSGAQSIVQVLQRKYPQIPVVNANDTQFIGMVERIGRFYMRCIGCGDCVTNDTGGICPITTCAKALMNGPCGGMVDGKCEVGNYEKDCGWVLIYNRLKALNRLEDFSILRDARDWRDSGHQRELVWR